MAKTIASVQRDIALNCGYKDDIIWDFLAADQEDALKQKIRHLIPDQETGMNDVNKMRKMLFENTWAQRKYTYGNLHSSIIYVMVTYSLPEYKEIASRAKTAVNFSCHPVIRTRKCLNDDSSKGCCMIFIDEVGRVYQNWKEYVEKNVLPQGFMVAPTHGVYTFDENDQVPLLCCPTPASSLKRKLIGAADKAACIGGIAATSVPIATLALPVAAPVIAASTAVAMCTAAYSAVRSGLDLKERRVHSQSISLTDRSARSSWISALSALAAVGAVGTTKVLAKVAATGKNINTASRCIVNGLNISSIILSGSGVANSVFHVILKLKDKERISNLNLAQFAASLVIFTHSINNFRFASTIANQARDGTIQKYRSELNKRQREVFDKMSKETIRIHGKNSEQVDIVRSFNDVPDFHSSNSQNSGIHFLSSCAEALSELTNLAGVQTVQALLTSSCGKKFIQIIFNADSFENVIEEMREYYNDDIIKFIMNIANVFVETSLDNITTILKTVIPAETILWRIFTHCKMNYKQNTLEFIESRTIEIFDHIERYFLKWNKTGFETQQLKKCPNCIGYYSVTNV